MWVATTSILEDRRSSISALTLEEEETLFVNGIVTVGAV